MVKYSTFIFMVDSSRIGLNVIEKCVNVYTHHVNLKTKMVNLLVLHPVIYIKTSMLVNIFTFFINVWPM